MESSFSTPPAAPALPDPPPSAIERAAEACGGYGHLARLCEVSAAAVTKWKRRVPAERVLQIEQATLGAVTRHELRPDLYPPEAAPPPPTTQPSTEVA